MLPRVKVTRRVETMYVQREDAIGFNQPVENQRKEFLEDAWMKHRTWPVAHVEADRQIEEPALSKNTWIREAPCPGRGAEKPFEDVLRLLLKVLSDIAVFDDQLNGHVFPS
jgi:hypothetical protein